MDNFKESLNNAFQQPCRAMNTKQAIFIPIVAVIFLTFPLKRENENQKKTNRTGAPLKTSFKGVYLPENSAFSFSTSTLHFSIRAQQSADTRFFVLCVVSAF